MLRNTKDLHGFTIRATDGDVGTVDQFYFEDETWAIRYLTVDTGGWLGGRLVLICRDAKWCDAAREFRQSQ